MATLKNTIKRLEKLSGEKIQVNGNNQHWINVNGYSLSFYPNGRMADDVEATGFYTKKNSVEDDMQSDYFSGTFHDNATQAFKFITRKN